MTDRKKYDKWTKPEEQKLIDAVFFNKDLTELFPNRSKGALQIRLYKLLNEMIDIGKLTPEEAVEKYRVDPEELQKNRDIQKNKLMKAGGDLVETVRQIRDLCQSILDKKVY